VVNGIDTVKAGPTKDFFVSMITRDIQLPDAIVELIDNSIDGIKRHKAEKYDGYFINVRFNKDMFEIEDNCGGISLQIAKEYAFVFGKPKAAREKEERVETTGTFGIGMKRALFKMGQKFDVQSKAEDSSFRLSVDVMDWMGKSDWDFPLAESDPAETNDVKTCGTKITVTQLHPGISQSFVFTPFANEVINIVQRRTNAEIINGLKITINDIVIGGSFLTIINSERVSPYKYVFESNQIKVMIIAGISAETDPDKAGWYVYCNNREILSADKSSLTTWKDDKDVDGIKYHNDYATFRGFIFFTSVFPEFLPWNTSKTGIDGSSQIYKEARPHMIDAFKVITSELKKLAKLEEDTRTAVTTVLRQNSTSKIQYYSALAIPVKTNVAFVDLYTEIVKQSTDKVPMTSVSYRVETKHVDNAKKALGVSSNKDVGLKTFEYYIEMEGINNA